MTMHIDNYSLGRIVINNKTYSLDVIVYPDRVDSSWWRKEGHYLNKEDLSKVVMAKPDIVIIGTGQSGVMEVPKSTVVFLESHGIKVYIEKTGRWTIQQSRQFPAVTLWQVSSGRANLIFNKIEVIEQPFPGRRNTAGCLNSLSQEIADFEQHAFIISQPRQKPVLCMFQPQLVLTRQGLAMLLHLITAEQFRPQRRLSDGTLLYPAVSAEPRPQMGQVPQDAFAAYLQVEVSF